MTGIVEKVAKDPEKRARAYLWAWIISTVVMAIGYVIIFYLILGKKLG